ncbi:MAG: nucleotidyltransferase family protein [Gammaproteobacteria bacterium]
MNERVPADSDRVLADIVLGRRELTEALYPLCEAEGLIAIAPVIAEAVQVRHQADLHEAVAAEMTRCRHDAAVLAALAEAGIATLVFKGGALAHTHYESSWHRTRSDIDILVREADTEAAIERLAQLGYSAGDSIPGRVSIAELAFYKTLEFGVVHAVDLHWRFNSSWHLARLVAFDDLWPTRQPIPGVGGFCPAPAWSLIIAALHRIAHEHYTSYEIDGQSKVEGDLTLWAYDASLIAGTMNTEDWQWLQTLCIERDLAEPVIALIDRASELFEVDVPDDVLASLQAARRRSGVFSTQGFLSKLLQSFLAVPGARLRLAWLREQLFPPSIYMRDVYGHEGWLWSGYLKRIARGLLRSAGR